MSHKANTAKVAHFIR